MLNVTESKLLARSRRDPELERALRAAVAKGSGIDYEQFRADLDAVADPRVRDPWSEWGARADGHVGSGGAEQG